VLEIQIETLFETYPEKELQDGLKKVEDMSIKYLQGN